MSIFGLDTSAVESLFNLLNTQFFFLYKHEKKTIPIAVTKGIQDISVLISTSVLTDIDIIHTMGYKNLDKCPQDLFHIPIICCRYHWSIQVLCLYFFNKPEL